MRFRRRARLILGVFLALYLLASAIGSYAVVAGDRGPLKVAAQQIGRRYEDVGFPSRVDSVPLSGWLFHSPSGEGRSVILVHGWHGNREDVDFAPLARALLARGYDVLMFDLRGSGTSGGATQTFARSEPLDVLGAHDFMVSRGYRADAMAVIGNSMGAASVIEAAPQLTDVAALICDSSYTAVTQAAEHGLSGITGLPGALALPALAFSRVWGIDPDLRPIDVVAGLTGRAFLFIQSRSDGLVDPASASELRAASRNPWSRLLIIDGSRHLDTFNHDPAAYLAAVTAFITQQISLRAGGERG